jgi:hypothetical protein
MNIIAQLGMAFVPAWASGLNLYAMVATLGLLGRFGGMKLPGDLEVLTNKWVIGAAIALYCVEFVADKIPIFDSVWDVVHTFLRVPAGAIVAAAALGDFNRPVQIIAFLAGGGLALSSHGAKAATRAALNLSPEPFSNIIASIIEDVLAILTTALAFVLPVLILTLVIAAFALTIWLLPKIIRLAGRTFSVARRAFAGNASVAR